MESLGSIVVVFQEAKACSSDSDCGGAGKVCFDGRCHAKCSKDSQCFGVEGKCSNDGRCTRADKIKPLKEKSEDCCTIVKIIL